MTHRVKQAEDGSWQVLAGNKIIASNLPSNREAWRIVNRYEKAPPIRDQLRSDMAESKGWR